MSGTYGPAPRSTVLTKGEAMNTRRLGGHGLFAEYRFMAVLSLLMAFASISTDLYLPAMPAMARELHIAPGLAAMTVSMYLVGLSVERLV